MILAQGQSADKGWDALMRLARGERELAADPKIAILSRHRRSATPPRQPLLASRDLPSPVMGSAVAATPSVVTLKPAQKLTSPHSPDPLSDGDIASMVADLPPVRERAHGPYIHGCADDVADLRPRTAQEALTALIAFAHYKHTGCDAQASAAPADVAAPPAPVILMLPSPALKLDRAVDEQLTRALAKLRAMSCQRQG